MTRLDHYVVLRLNGYTPANARKISDISSVNGKTLRLLRKACLMKTLSREDVEGLLSNYEANVEAAKHTLKVNRFLARAAKLVLLARSTKNES